MSAGGSFAGRRVLVTGASRGIGRTIADMLVEEGAFVLAHYSRHGKELKAAARGGSLMPIQGDLSTREGVISVADRVREVAPRLDGLVNNAGVYSGRGIAKETFDNWDRLIAINLRSPFFLTKLLREELKRAGGSVVNISSIMGCVPSPGAYPYQASKAALRHLTSSLSMELAPDIRVNCVAPGFIMTDMNKEGWDDAEFRSSVIESTPLRRWGITGDIASVVGFLLSSGASFITGQTILVDGGKGFV